MWRISRLPMRKSIRKSRDMLDGVIQNVKSGNRPAHYLVYG